MTSIVKNSLKKSNKIYHAKNPFLARLLSCERLNHPHSSKEILHVTLDITGSDIGYKPGGSFALYPQNDEERIQELLEILNLTGDESVYIEKLDETISIRSFFQKKANLSKVSMALHKLYEIEEKHLMDFCQELPTDYKIDDLCNKMTPLLPRFYSIASSNKVSENTIDLMIASFQYEERGDIRESITASYLKSLQPDSAVALYYQENARFSLPEDETTPIIMIGPGTGMAAFRGFLQERVATKASGKNWLFTGDRNREWDFHYQKELFLWESTGKLKLSTAFSRDYTEKVYVQDKILEEKAAIWDWINNQKAIVYISGDAKRMAKDVQKTLREIAMEVGQLSEVDAREWISALRREKRLLLDVY